MNQVSQLPHLSKYNIIETLGSGSYGTVFKASLKSEAQLQDQKSLYAIKHIKCDKKQEGIPSTAIRECGILKHLSHKNIVQLKEIIAEPANMYLAFEFCDADLKKYMTEIPRETGMDPQNVKVVAP